MMTLLLLWIICGVLGYGLYFAYAQRGFPELAEEELDEDRKEAAIIALLGLLGLGIAIGIVVSKDQYHGFKWK